MISNLSSHQGISEIARTLVERKRLNLPRPILLLGAGASVESGCPTIVDLYQRIAQKLDRPEIATDFRVMQQFMTSRAESFNELYSQIVTELDMVSASLGYEYLAALISEGYFEIIFTLNFDGLLENTISRYTNCRPHLKLVRGEHSDEYITRALGFYPPKVKIVKLHGDLHGRSYMLTEKDLLRFPGEIEKTITNLIRNSDLILVGTQMNDLDVLASIPQDHGSIWYINPIPPESTSHISHILARKNLIENVVSGDLGRFDAFFQQLGQKVKKIEFEKDEESRRMNFNSKIRKSLINIDLNYSDTLIRRLALEILEKCNYWKEPTLLVYIHDPEAPGGSEVKKRINRYLTKNTDAIPTSTQIEVRGKSIRWVDRTASQLREDVLGKKYSKVVVLDSISFTGRTLHLATLEIRKEIPSAEIFWAVLVASNQLVQSLPQFGMERADLVTVFETDRHDIYFPWGWTQATGTMTREVELFEGIQSIQVIQRPWGTIEVFSEDQICSVRLHTIRASHRMSFQRHFFRDELFIALDDHIGIEFESSDGQVKESAILPKGHDLLIPRGLKHRIAAYKDTGRVLEIAFGFYDQIYDIERFEDDYGRVGLLGDV